MNQYIDNKADLIQYFYDSCTVESDWKIGTEHEKFLFCKSTQKRLPYDGSNGIRAVLQKTLDSSDAFTPIWENSFLIGLQGGNGDSITLEPGGQLELSGAPLQNIHETNAEISNHIHTLKTICKDFNIDMVGLGYDPITPPSQVPWMPKGRYALMRDYMPTKGTLGTQMMTMTSTVQVNLDYSSESDMAEKMRIGAVLQPLATALFANSVIGQGKDLKYQSWRSHIWTDTDADRCGMPIDVLRPHMSFEKWIEYALDIPMYFVYRDGIYHNALGKSFRKYLDGKLDVEGFYGKKPTLEDWKDHLTTAFPEIRLKNIIEMRGADSGSLEKLSALPAFWVGLLYDSNIRSQVADMINPIAVDAVLTARDSVAEKGLCAVLGDKTLLQWAQIILPLSRQGLQNRNYKDAQGLTEIQYIDCLSDIVTTGKSESDNLKSTLQEHSMNAVWQKTLY